MLILLLGATNICSSLASALCQEGHDICVISEHSTALQHLQQFVDCQTVVGCPSHPHVLRQANAGSADMMIAATKNDEMNMVACQVAYSLFKIKRKIAFISSAHYLIKEELFGNINMPIDTLISLDDIIAEQLAELVSFSSGLLHIDLGSLSLALTTINNNTDLANTEVLAAFRGKELIKDDFTIGDKVLFICHKNELNKKISMIHGPRNAANKITLGAEPGVIAAFAKHYQDSNIKVIEPNLATCEHLSQAHEAMTILHGQITENELLSSESMDKVDVFCAITNDDEDNIMAALQAKELGAKKTIAMINKSYYKQMLEHSTLDFILDPKPRVLEQVLAHVNHPWIQNIHKIPRTAYQIIELKNPEKIHRDKLKHLNIIACIHKGKVITLDEIPENSIILILIKASDNKLTLI